MYSIPTSIYQLGMIITLKKEKHLEIKRGSYSGFSYGGGVKSKEKFKQPRIKIIALPKIPTKIFAGAISYKTSIIIFKLPSLYYQMSINKRLHK